MPNDLEYRPNSPPPPQSPPLSITRYSWLTVAEVCRRWYSVACHSPELWTSIHLPGNSEFVLLSLERSGTAPLTVYYESIAAPPGWPITLYAPPDPSRTEVLTSVLECKDRIRHLDICVESVEFGELHNFVNATYPVLETCRLHFAYAGDFEVDHTFPLSSEDTLRVLSLKYLSLSPVHFNSLPGLRELSLEFIDMWSGIPFTLSSLLDILANLPVLEILHLGWLTVTLDSSGDSENEVSLPHLQKLELVGLDPMLTGALLDSIWIPGTAHVDITFYSGQPGNLSEANASSLLQSIASTLSSSGRLDLAPIALTFYINIISDAISFSGYGTRISSRDMLPSSEAMFAVKMPFSLIGGMHLGEVVEIFPLQDVRILWLVSGVAGAIVPPLSRLSTSMPAVEEIHSLGIGFERFLMDTECIMAPTLPWLKLTRLAFDSSVVAVCDHNECTCYGNNTRGCRCLQRLRDILQFRSVHDCARLARLSAHSTWFCRYARSYITELLTEYVDDMILSPPHPQ